MSRRFLNREWSWLAFNSRVLAEAGRPETPLLERIKFLAISSSNLEEFFMIRVAALKRLGEMRTPPRSPDGLLPAGQLAGIRSRVLDMMKMQYSILDGELIPGLLAAGVRLLSTRSDLEPWMDELSSFYHDTVRPVLTPISVGTTHPFPNLVTGRLYLAVSLRVDGDRTDLLEKCQLSFVEIPVRANGRFVRLDPQTCVPLELVVRMFLPGLFGGYSVAGAWLVKVTRDADLDIEQDAAGDLLRLIETKLTRMHHRSVVRLEYELGMDESLRGLLAGQLGVGEEDQYPIAGLFTLHDLFALWETIERDDLKYQEQPPVSPRFFSGGDVFKAIAARDRLLFHPYHSYAPVIELLSQAADDPAVLAIKQTLYRTSADSSVITALERAARSGKYVSVIVELKARFEERRNIAWARRLEDAGAHVMYGLAGLKTHAKLLLVVRKEQDGIRRYVHLATGNYNESTARVYTDLSFFTAGRVIGDDVAALCNMLTGFTWPQGFSLLSVAPLDFRQKLLALIGREEDNARRGQKASITAMMNSLSDSGVIEALGRAADAGVRIRLVVRGICQLVPGDNISVRSIVGRYLQHARVCHVHNGGDDEYYLSSADWMLRNLTRRVELFFPVRDEALREFLREVLQLQFMDTVNAWELRPDGSYQRVQGRHARDSFAEIRALVERMEAASADDVIQRFVPLRHIHTDQGDQG